MCKGRVAILLDFMVFCTPKCGRHTDLGDFAGVFAVSSGWPPFSWAFRPPRPGLFRPGPSHRTSPGCLRATPSFRELALNSSNRSAGSVVRHFGNPEQLMNGPLLALPGHDVLLAALRAEQPRIHRRRLRRQWLAGLLVDVLNHLAFGIARAAQERPEPADALIIGLLHVGHLNSSLPAAAACLRGRRFAHRRIPDTVSRRGIACRAWTGDRPSSPRTWGTCIPKALFARA